MLATPCVSDRKWKQERSLFTNWPTLDHSGEHKAGQHGVLEETYVMKEKKKEFTCKEINIHTFVILAILSVNTKAHKILNEF